MGHAAGACESLISGALRSHGKALVWQGPGVPSTSAPHLATVSGLMWGNPLARAWVLVGAPPLRRGVVGAGGGVVCACGDAAAAVVAHGLCAVAPYFAGAASSRKNRAVRRVEIWGIVWALTIAHRLRRL